MILLYIFTLLLIIAIVLIVINSSKESSENNEDSKPTHIDNINKVNTKDKEVQTNPKAPKKSTEEGKVNVTENTEATKIMQEIALATYLCKFADCSSEEGKLLCRLFNVDYAVVVPLVEMCNRTSKNKLFAALATVKDKKYIDTFVNFSCTYLSFFINNKDYEKELLDISKNWGYTESELKFKLSTVDEEFNVDFYTPTSIFPLNLQEQNVLLREWVKTKIHFKDNNINTLNHGQKYALFGLALSMAHLLYTSRSRIDLITILANYAVTLNFDIIASEDVLLYQTPLDKEKYISIIRTTIKDNKVLNDFIKVCLDIIDFKKSMKNILSFKIRMFEQFDFFYSDLISIAQGKFVTKYYEGRKNQDNEKRETTNKKIIEEKEISDSSIIKQKTALLKLVIWLVRDETEDENKEKIRQFTNELSAKLGLSSTYKSLGILATDDVDAYIKITNTIQDNALLLTFINACRKVLRLSSTACMWASLDYRMILDALGFYEKDLFTLMNLQVDQKLPIIKVLPERKAKVIVEKIETLISQENDLTVTKESKNKREPLFIKSWSFLEFYKMFDKMMYKVTVNRETGKKFTACAFWKDNTITYVGFHSSLGELTKLEIKEREHEIKVGLKESGTYLFYVGKMPDKCIFEEVDLGI